MSEERRSASLSGAGSLGGGEYTRVSISGAGKVNGDLIADELKISGAGKVQGRTEAVHITVSGSGSFSDAVIADEMKVSGSAKVDGSVDAKELKCSGTFRATGDMSSEYIKVTGHIRVGGDVESDIFKASGGFDIEGLLSADKIEIRTGGRCQAREIGGERIDVRRGGFREKGIFLDGLIKIFTGGGAAEVRTSTIEGDVIHLEDTVADVVRGKRVEIGPGCRIASVEYSESLEIHDSAAVERQTKV